MRRKTAEMQQEVDTYEQDKADFNSFSVIVRKHVGIKELTPTIVNEFVKQISVHAPDKSSRMWRLYLTSLVQWIFQTNRKPSQSQRKRRHSPFWGLYRLSRITYL